MRMISGNNLPLNYHQHSIIKGKERDHYQRMAASLERTLARCNEMYAEYESHTVLLRENSQKEGFSMGFELFFSQLVDFLEDYEKRQKIRLTTFRSKLLSSIKESFNDTVIVERIIHNLQIQSGQHKPLRIIIPKTVKLPTGADDSNYILTDDNHITIQNDMDSIRFPIDSVCQQWLAESDESIHSLSQEIDKLSPDFLENIGQQPPHIIVDDNK
ncbi:type III secretion protein [uncultured Cedecea sp.]|uniref:type III secretion protein n=1 Tax=uncultured Cedecea sp. TaxID=988762 RepID=UPI002638EC80|nr:type III secretion protein [uncultured Cedecea sp.]